MSSREAYNNALLVRDMAIVRIEELEDLIETMARRFGVTEDNAHEFELVYSWMSMPPFAVFKKGDDVLFRIKFQIISMKTGEGKWMLDVGDLA